MTTPYAFDVEVNQNEYLPAGGEVMDAVLSVRCTSGSATPVLSAAEVIIVDTSGSMSGAKLVQAKLATEAALARLRDGVRFAIVAGDGQARMVYPARQRLAVLSARTRDEAKKALGRLRADDGTDIAPWLELAHALLVDANVQVKHAILLTDGHSIMGSRFDKALRRCRGVFRCDSRGVGNGWRAEPLQRIADATQGGAEGMPDPSELSENFRELTEVVMGTAATDVLLRVWTPPDARITLLTQSHPWLTELTGSASDPGFTDYPIGQWGNETRHYHLRVQAPAGGVGDERAIARVQVLAGPAGSRIDSGEHTVWINWTSDPALSTRINQQVANATGQSELAAVIEEGLQARRAGQDDVATDKLARAFELARQHQRTETLRLLSNIADVDDSGTIRLRRSIEEVHAEMALLDSRKTVQTRPEIDDNAFQGGPK